MNHGAGYVDAGGVTGISGQTSAALSLNNASISALSPSATFQCVVSNVFGAVTSSVASLAVATASPPTLTAQLITNYVGNSFSISAIVGGTDPKFGYQWYSNNVALVDDAKHAGTMTGALSFVNLTTNDAAVYQLSVTNNYGSVSNVAVTLVIKYAPPAFVQPPANNYLFLGNSVTFSNSVSGFQVTNKWYTSSKTGVLTPVSLGGRYAQVDDYSVQPAKSYLTISSTLNTDATNYVVVVSNPSGSITSAPVSLALFVQPASHTYANYASVGQVYSNDFNALPVPGGGSYEAGNPQNATFIMTNFIGVAANSYFGNSTNSTEIDYSIDNPVDFGYPVLTNGAIGGFGLSNKMSGWYALSQNAKKQFFGITSGDQSAAGILDNGLNFNNINGYTTQTLNRALGLITSTASGNIAIGLALVNNTGKTNQVLNASFIGELWRNNPLQQALNVGYIIDPSGSSAFPSNAIFNGLLTPISGLTVAFPTTVDTAILNGTQVINQTNLSVSSFPISDWTPGSTLWLVWQSSTSVGGAQNVAIDNLSLSATPTPVVVSTPINLNSSPSYVPSGVNAGLHLGFSNTPGGD
ncbi:MAG: immunoglobulin domain-containing protein, partial [Verrucomicrobiota bacterium]